MTGKFSIVIKYDEYWDNNGQAEYDGTLWELSRIYSVEHGVVDLYELTAFLDLACDKNALIYAELDGALMHPRFTLKHRLYTTSEIVAEILQRCEPHSRNDENAIAWLTAMDVSK